MGDVHPAIDVELKKLLPPESYELRPNDRDSRSLFGEILDWMLAPLLLLWPMSIAVTYLVAQSIANAPFDRSLENSVQAIGEQIKRVDGRISLTLPMAARKILRADESDTIYFQVIGYNGELIAGDKDLPLPIEGESLQIGVTTFRDSRVNGDEVRIASTQVTLDVNEPTKVLLVQVAETLEKRAQLANEIIKGVILPQFIILPIVVMLVWFGLTRGLAPLNALQNRIKKRRVDDTSPIEERAAPLEIMPLISSFNDVLYQLEDSVLSQKRFIADAAHQLKTPLAGLRMQAELAQRGSSPEELQRSLEQISDSSMRATRLVQQLLSLARMENLTNTNEKILIDLSVEAAQATKHWLNAAWEKNIDLGYEARDEDLQIFGNPVMLKELFNNLIDNAIKYTPAHGHITVDVRHSNQVNLLVIEVKDTGPGIPPEERQRVLERFYRVLGSDVEGSGLGLAIVKEIATQHGGKLEILEYFYDEDRSKYGTCMRVYLPVGNA